MKLGGGEIRVVTGAVGKSGAAIATSAGRLIDVAGLGYLIKLGLSTVVLAETAAPTRTTGPTRPLIVSIPPTRCPLSFATRLLDETAAGWLRLFALLDHAPDPTAALRRWDDAGTAQAERYLGLAVRIRLLESLLADGEFPAGVIQTSPAGVWARLESARQQAAADLTLAYTVAQSLPLCARDLLVSQFPGPMRFAKYEAGGGVGQA